LINGIKIISKGIKIVSSCVNEQRCNKKMVTETKISILDALERHSDGLHLRKLTSVVDGSFPNIRRFVHALKEEGVVKTEQQGNLLNIKLNDSIPTLAYLKFVQTERFMALSAPLQGVITEFLNRLPYKPVIALLVPAIAAKKHTYDLALIFQTVEHSEDIRRLLQEISARHGITLNPIIVDYTAFERSFLDHEHVFSNRIRHECIVFVGVEYYYRLLWRFLR